MCYILISKKLLKENLYVRYASKKAADYEYP